MVEFLNSFSKLEFQKIKSHVCRYAISPANKINIENILPLSSQSEIQNNLDHVSETKILIESDDPLPLDGLADIRVPLSKAKIIDSFLAAEVILNIKMQLVIARNIASYFAKRKGNYPLLNQLITTIYFDKILEYNIDLAIDEYGNIKDTASSDLKRIRRELFDLNEQLRKRLGKILKTVTSEGWAQEEIITTRDGRMVIPVKTENKNMVPGFVHSMSGSGATVFVEPAETLEMNNDIRSLQFREIREIEKILKDLTIQVRDNADKILNNLFI